MPKKITNIDLFQASNFLADKYASKILAATYNSPKSAKQLSKKFNIPIAACYRRIRELEKIGLLVVAGVVYNRRGKTTKLYQSQLNGVYIFLRGDRLKVHFKLASGKSLTMTRAGS